MWWKMWPIMMWWSNGRKRSKIFLLPLSFIFRFSRFCFLIWFYFMVLRFFCFAVGIEIEKVYYITKKIYHILSTISLRKHIIVAITCMNHLLFLTHVKNQGISVIIVWFNFFSSWHMYKDFYVILFWALIFKIKQPWCDGRCDQWFDGVMEEKEAT